MADDPLAWEDWEGFGIDGLEDFKAAQYLAIKLDGTWRYDHTAKRWHHWDKHRWAPDRTGKVRQVAARLASRGALEAKTEIERKALMRLMTLVAVDKALEALSTFPEYGTDGADWDQDPYLLGCKNGIVDLRTNTLDTTPDPTCLVTKTTGQTFEPCSGPKDFEDRAPLFMAFMDQITSEDPTMVSFLLLWFGSSMFGFSPEQRFLLMTGIGRNGKGALKHSVMEAAGEYGCQPDANVYMRSKLGGISSANARADLMDLKGKRIGFFSEPEGNRFNEEMLKAHTGGDMITARALHSNNVISWAPTHSITFLVNNAPEVEDLGPSMGARTMVADFRERYDGEKEDKTLYRKLGREAEGILAILCWAASAWYRSWDATGQGITMPPRVIEQSKQFMERNDVVAAALNDALVLDYTARTRSSLLYETYLQWHARSDRTDEPISQRRFSQALERKGFKGEKRSDGNYVIGLKPKSALRLAEEETDD